jgi:acyl-CoA synthetase (AMP-forming)/AMP-acid ligase II
VYLAEEGRAIAPGDLREFLTHSLAPFKVPVQLWQVDEPLPRLGTEKIDKRSLREKYSALWKARSA